MLDACKNRKVVRWFRIQASGHNSQGVVDGRVNKASVSTTVPGRSAVLLLRVECPMSWVAIRNVVAPAPQSEPASRFRSGKRDISFLRSNSRYRRYVSDLSTMTPR